MSENSLADSLKAFREASANKQKEQTPTVKVDLDLARDNDLLEQLAASETRVEKIESEPPQSSAPKKVSPVEQPHESTVTVMKQGNTYEEQDLSGKSVDEDEDSDVDELLEEDSGIERRPKDKIGKINTKMILLSIAGVVLLITVILGISLIAGQRKKELAAKRAAEYESALTEQESVMIYTPEEISSLRLAGYTGDEIEENELNQIPSDVLIQEAEEARQQQYENEVAPYYDTSSDEFKYIFNNTWLSGDDLIFDRDDTQWQHYNENLNVDYEKLPQKGNQLWIKFYLPNGKACFSMVTPERWVTLPDSGNIVLSIDYVQTVDGSQIITDVNEVRN